MPRGEGAAVGQLYSLPKQCGMVQGQLQAAADIATGGVGGGECVGGAGLLRCQGFMVGDRLPARQGFSTSSAGSRVGLVAASRSSFIARHCGGMRSTYSGTVLILAIKTRRRYTSEECHRSPA